MIDESYTLPSQSWLQSLEYCSLCQSQKNLLSMRDLKVTNDRINARFKELAIFRSLSAKAKDSISKIYKPSEVKTLGIMRDKLKKDLEMLKERTAAERETWMTLEAENIEWKQRLKNTANQRTVKEEVLLMKKNVHSDLRSRLKELSNMLFVERMKHAVNIFRMMSLEVVIPGEGTKDGRSASPNQRHMQLTGCSSIMSLPLPNNGVYSELPYETTAVALSHTARLVDALSSALNIPLMHPIVQVTATECMISPQYDLSACYTLSAVRHLSDRERHDAFSWKPLSEVKKDLAADPCPSNGSADSGTGVGGIYVVNHAFPQALTLLQADVVGLCLKAGIPPDCIWPPQALLLNLYELLMLCAKCVKRNSAPPSQSILTAKAAAGTKVDLAARTVLDPVRHLTVPTVFEESEGPGSVVDALTKKFSAPRGNGQRVTLDLPATDDAYPDAAISFVSVRASTSPSESSKTILPSTLQMMPSVVEEDEDEDQEDDKEWGRRRLAAEEYDMLDMLNESRMLDGDEVPPFALRRWRGEYR